MKARRRLLSSRQQAAVKPISFEGKHAWGLILDLESDPREGQTQSLSLSLFLPIALPQMQQM